MQKGSSNYERIILIIVAVLGIAGGGWFIYASLGFDQSLERKDIPPKPLTWDVSIKTIDDAIAHAVKDPSVWTAPVISNKPVPLFKSVLLVVKNEQPDQLVDMFTEEVPIRPPFTNKWLRENRMPYKTPNVGDLDADGDGFTDLEEFQKQTDPNDPNSHPPITEHIFLVDRVEHKYLIVLKSSGNPPFQVRITTEDGKSKSAFVTPGAVDSTGKPDIKASHFGAGDRFEAKKFEQKEIPDPRVGMRDVSELTILDKLRKVEIVLIKDKELNLAEFEGVFELRHKVVETIKARKGDSFPFSSQLETTYKVIDIKEDGAVISPLKPTGEPESEILIKKG